MIYSKNIMEKENRLHNFTVCFYEDRVIIGEQSVKLGKITTDILALPDEVSDSLRLSLENLKKAFKDKLYMEFIWKMKVPRGTAVFNNHIKINHICMMFYTKTALTIIISKP